MKNVKNIGILLILLVWLSLLFTVDSCNAEAINNFIQGRVLDEKTGLPIANATVQVWDVTKESPTMWRLMNVRRTDYRGYFSITVDSEFQSRIYVYYDNPNSSGFDYIPAFQDFFISGNKNLTFWLNPGGSMVLEGELLFVESTRPPDTFVFTVIDPNTTSRPSEEGNVYDYGVGPMIHNFLNLDPEYLIVPADMTINIIVNASMMVEGERIYRAFLASHAENLILEKGQEVRIRLEASLSRFKLDLMENYAAQTKESLDKLEQKGFYITLEKNDLAKVNNLIDIAENEMVEGSYEECHADLREAYIEILQINERVEGIYVNAYSSVATLTLFLTITALALSSFLLEPWPLKTAATCIFSSLFLVTLYFVYPGLRLIQTSLFFIYIILSLVIAFIIPLLLPRLIGEKAVSAFSIAKQNLKRRRLRFMLTLISVIVLSMSFVTLTSFSTGYGLTSRSLNAADLDSEGVLVRSPMPPDLSRTITFIPLEDSTITWIGEKTEVARVAPKLENFPSLRSIGFLSSSNEPSNILPIFGELGIQPSVEAEITHIDDIIVKGRYLEDDESGVLISTKAAEKLNSKVGDQLILANDFSQINVTVVGFFDGSNFREIKDVDAKPLIPQKQIMTEGKPPMIDVIPCDPSEVVITNVYTALKIPGFFLSRLCAQLNNPDLTPSFARRIVLERDLWVWTNYNGQLHTIRLEEYAEAKGLSIAIPWVIVILNVIITMLNAVFERRREIAVLSSIGLNPSHIGGLFMAEATVVGIIGGGIGYIFGLGGYQALSALSIIVEVRQKVSAFWSLASIGVAMAAVLVGTTVAIKQSVIITPSLLRKWTMEQQIENIIGSEEFYIPIRLREGEEDDLLDYLKNRIQNHVRELYPQHSDLVGKRTKESDEKTLEAHIKSINFRYAFGQGQFGDPVGSFPFTLIAEKKENEETYDLKLFSKSGEAEPVRKLVTFVRMLVVDWSAHRK